MFNFLGQIIKSLSLVTTPGQKKKGSFSEKILGFMCARARVRACVSVRSCVYTSSRVLATAVEGGCSNPSVRSVEWGYSVLNK